MMTALRVAVCGSYRCQEVGGALAPEQPDSKVRSDMLVFAIVLHLE